VPFGSIEHHGSHLPLGTDALLADAIGREVAERLGAVLAPTVRVGDADQHLDGLGTLSLGAETLTDVAIAVSRSLARQRFRTIVLLSTHGGNLPALRSAAEQLAAAGVIVRVPRGDVGPDPGAHSGEWITSVMLALRPELVAGELEGASAERGREHLERFINSLIDG
jgi:creatinine amidohydrolase